MMTAESGAMLARALELSRELLVIAEDGDLQTAVELGTERMRLLRESRLASAPVGEAERLLLKEIAELNDRAIGFLEHRLRIKGREVDTASLGRRAVAAYSTTRPPR